jgi:hypothetical protein
MSTRPPSVSFGWSLIVVVGIALLACRREWLSTEKRSPQLAA